MGNELTKATSCTAENNLCDAEKELLEQQTQRTYTDQATCVLESGSREQNDTAFVHGRSGRLCPCRSGGEG